MEKHRKMQRCGTISMRRKKGLLKRRGATRRRRRKREVSWTVCLQVLRVQVNVASSSSRGGSGRYIVSDAAYIVLLQQGMRAAAGKTAAPPDAMRDITPKDADKVAGRERGQRLLTARLNVPEAEAALKWYMKRHEDLKGMCRPCDLFKVPAATLTALSVCESVSYPRPNMQDLLVT